MKVLFWVYSSRATSTGEAPIMMRITHSGKRVNITLDVKVVPAQWDSKRQRVKGNGELAQTINAHVQSCETKVVKAYDHLFKKSETITARQIADAYTGTGVIHKRLEDAFKDYIKSIEAKIGIDYTVGTINVYKGTLSKVMRFLTATSRKDITLEELDRKFIADLDQYLRAVLRSANNTTVKNLKQLKSVLKYSRIMGWISHDPFDFMTFKQVDSKREYLTSEEILALANVHLPIPSLEKVRDLFMFQIYTGLSYQDLFKLTSTDIKVGNDGKRWIYIFRTKTDSLSQIPLLPVAESILEKYHSHSKVVVTGRLLPVVTNQVYNRYLKTIFSIAGIKKNASSHVGRHTFATTILLSKGISLETISRLLGHTTPRTTEIYAKITEQKIAGEVAVLWN